MNGLDALREHGGMTWIEAEQGWVAAPEEIVKGVSKLELDPHREDGGEG